jgi:eukaryotic-like serine/threonine-protein kinase
MSALDDRGIDRLRAMACEPGPGDVLDGRFEIDALIGEGAMGLVYAARDRESGRPVAVKFVRVAPSDEHARARLAREAASLAKVTHPAIVGYVAEGAHAAGRYLVMERLDGMTLAVRLAQSALSVAEAATLGARIAAGLAAVHGAGLVHRDVKPSNIFLSGGAPSAPRLLDFGLARAAEAGRVTSTGALVGTPGYMAPEQVRGEPAGPPADVFALGCVLHECLAGQPAFVGEETELFARILLESPPHVGALRSGVPPALEALIERMLDKREALRPTASEVTRELAAVAVDRGAATSDGEASLAGLPAPGTVVGGKYRVEHLLGEGGMGVVLAAKHLELGTRVALKLLRGPRRGAHEARFFREAQAAARLESDHAARVLDVGRLDDGTPFIVMEHLSGRDLARLLRERGPLAIEAAAHHLLQACEALAEAHSLGIVHRDLKPSNLFLASRRDGSEVIKVLDFGISKWTRPEHPGASSITGASAVLGSAWYMSPEQLRDSKRVDARTDIWSLGVVLFELVAGSPPFDGDSAAAVGARIAASEPRALRELVPDAPPALSSVILRCLAKDPAHRFPDVAALARALAPLAGAPESSLQRLEHVLQRPDVGPASSTAAADTAAPTGTSPAWHAPPPGPRRRWPAAAVLAAGIAAALGWTLSLGGPPPSPPSTATRTEPERPAFVAAPGPEPAASAAPAPVASPTPEAEAAPVAPASAVRPKAAPPRRQVQSAETPARPAPAPSAAQRRRSAETDLLDPALQGR